MKASTGCIKIIRACALGAARAGIQPLDVAAHLGLPLDVLSDPHARIPDGLIRKAWEEIPARAGDPAFGIHTAETTAAMPFDVIDFAAAQAKTLRAAIDCMVRYARLHHDDAEVRLVVTGGEARVTVRFRSAPGLPRHFAECIVTTWVLRTRALLGSPFSPSLVHFEHGPPADLREHRRVLGSPLAFYDAQNGMAFPAALLEAPVRNAEPALFTVLESHATALLRALPERRSAAENVRAFLLRGLPAGLPPLATTAKALGVSGRSLQRALKDEGTTYQDVADQARRDLAISYLADKARTISDIALLLGFAEVPAFTRAFRRWTGQAPGAYRRQGGEGAGASG